VAVIINREGFRLSEHLRLIKGKPLRRPTAPDPFVSAGNRNAIPMLVPRNGQVTRVIQDGDQDLSVRRGITAQVCVFGDGWSLANLSSSCES
jgi:hypothetical protein